MYITTDLFGPDPRTPSTALHTSSHMSETQATSGLGKRKRRLDAEEGTSMGYGGTPKSLCSAWANNMGCASHPSPQRTSPEVNRTYRILHAQDHVTNDPTPWAHRLSPNSLSYTITGSRPIKQAKRSTYSSRKIGLAKQSSHLMDTEPDVPLSTDAPTHMEHTISDLRPCRVCHKAPKRRKDLENYLQCQTCQNRACYVCARSCSGRCGKHLCSKCCVEVGEEGDAWCLGCYQRNGNT